jgi:hypothetical protein
MKNRYPALKIVSRLSVIFGWLIFLVGGLWSFFTMIAAGGSGFGFFGLPLLLACIVLGLFLIATGELINVVIDIEANTRANSRLNEQVANVKDQDKKANSDPNDEKKGVLRVFPNGNWQCPVCNTENHPPIGTCKSCDNYIVAKR